MAKSLLSSFANDYNRTISVFPKVTVKNSIGEMTTTWPTALTTGTKCLLLLTSEQYRQFVSGQVEYIKTTHKVRLDFGPVVNVGDRIKDQNNVVYDVRFVTRTPGFWGVDDHLLLLVDIII